MLLLPEASMVEAWDSSALSESGKRWIDDNFHRFFTGRIVAQAVNRWHSNPKGPGSTTAQSI